MTLVIGRREYLRIIPEVEYGCVNSKINLGEEPQASQRHLYNYFVGEGIAFPIQDKVMSGRDQGITISWLWQFGIASQCKPYHPSSANESRHVGQVGRSMGVFAQARNIVGVVSLLSSCTETKSILSNVFIIFHSII